MVDDGVSSLVKYYTSMKSIQCMCLLLGDVSVGVARIIKRWKKPTCVTLSESTVSTFCCSASAFCCSAIVDCCLAISWSWLENFVLYSSLNFCNIWWTCNWDNGSTSIVQRVNVNGDEDGQYARNICICLPVLACFCLLPSFAFNVSSSLIMQSPWAIC